MVNRRLAVYRGRSSTPGGWTTSLVDLLTFNYHIHIFDKPVDDLEDLCYGLPSFVMRQPVQPLDHRLHFLLANKLPNNFFFIHKSGNEFRH